MMLDVPDASKRSLQELHLPQMTLSCQTVRPRRATRQVPSDPPGPTAPRLPRTLGIPEVSSALPPRLPLVHRAPRLGSPVSLGSQRSLRPPTPPRSDTRSLAGEAQCKRGRGRRYSFMRLQLGGPLHFKACAFSTRSHVCKDQGREQTYLPQAMPLA